MGSITDENHSLKIEWHLLILIDAYMYTNGSAGTNSTYDANLREFRKWGIVPRMLLNATQRNLEVRSMSQMY